MGLLMNHLGVDGRGRVVFDAGDAVVGGQDEEEGEDDEEGGRVWREAEGDIELGRLRRAYTITSNPVVLHADSYRTHPLACIRPRP